MRVLVAAAAVGALVIGGCVSGHAASSRSTIGTAASEPVSSVTDVSAPTMTGSGDNVSRASWDEETITLSDGTPTRDWGVVAAPTAGGPYPVVVIIHGNHRTCPTDTGGGTWPCPSGTEQSNHEGLGYLAEALAARGFVAVAPGINAQYTLGAGEPKTAARTAEIVEHTLAALVHGRLGVDTARVDVSRVVLVGHSVGGQDAGMMAAGRTSFARPVAGVVMLQPALNDGSALPLVDVPAVVVLSECDGDTGVRGGDYITTELQRTRRTPAAVVVLERANHNFTNTNLGADPGRVEAPACDPGNLLEPAQQQHALAMMVPELVHAVLDDGLGLGWAGSVFSEPTPPPGVLLGVVSAGEPVASVPGSGPRPPASLQATGMTLTFCPEGYYTPFVKPGSEPCHRPELPMMVGYPRTIACSSASAGASLTLALTTHPSGLARLRVLADFADERLNQPLRLRLTAPGVASTDVEIPLPDVRREHLDPFTVAFGLAMWSTVTLPVPDGAAQITVEVLGPTAGSMQILSLAVYEEP